MYLIYIFERIWSIAKNGIFEKKCKFLQVKKLTKMLARGSGFAGQNDFVFGCRGSGSIIVSIPKTTSSAILRGFVL